MWLCCRICYEFNLRILNLEHVMAGDQHCSIQRRGKEWRTGLVGLHVALLQKLNLRILNLEHVGAGD